MIVAAATQKMIEFYKDSIHDIDHFLKVWAMAKTIGELEGLDRHTQEVLELAAVVHDIACPLCREKYGNTNGKNQELESPPLVEKFFEGLSVECDDVERISWLVAHHHTYSHVDGRSAVRSGTMKSLSSFPATAWLAQTAVSPGMPAGLTRSVGCWNWSIPI